MMVMLVKSLCGNGSFAPIHYFKNWLNVQFAPVDWVKNEMRYSEDCGLQ